MSLSSALPVPDAAGELRRAIAEKYVYRDLRGVDWDAAFARHAPALRAARSPEEFVDAAAPLLALARDVHVTIRAGERALQPYQHEGQVNLSLPLIPPLVPDLRGACGHATSGAGYLMIGAWSAEWEAAAHRALDALLDAPALILDVRPNVGGDDRVALGFAGRFVEKPVAYDFVEEVQRQQRVLRPNRSAARYRGKVAVLMGPCCGSSNESFLLMMRAAGATLVGARSHGSSGNPRPNALSNGVVVSLPSWREYDLQGALIEGNGIEPDLHVAWPEAPSEDVVLRAAMEKLS